MLISKHIQNSLFIIIEINFQFYLIKFMFYKSYIELKFHLDNSQLNNHENF